MDINKINNSFQGNLSSPDKLIKNSGFKQIFDQKVAEINPLDAPLPIINKTNILEHGDRILNLLDDYSTELVNPAKSLKDIEPLVKRIQKEMDSIKIETGDKTTDDKELEGLIRDLVVTANVAVSKFHRGDYL